MNDRLAVMESLPPVVTSFDLYTNSVFEPLRVRREGPLSIASATLHRMRPSFAVVVDSYDVYGAEISGSVAIA